MGVTGLWKLIDQTGRVVPVESLENKVLAIDISIWLHQVVKGFQDSTGAALPHAHLLGLFHRLCKLLFYRIKPIFVFDGGVPYLKYETMRKRQENKRNYRGEADRIQNLLLESLAREKIAQQALSTSAGAAAIEDKLKSPRKNLPPRQQIKSNYQLEKDDLFKLPPLADNGEEFIDLKTDKLLELDEKPSRCNPNLNINTIDVKSVHFQSLPADVRHEILTDLKDRRKESSWGRLHELPVDSDDFSEFQMKRLLKRRQVQVSLEDAEKEMGGKCMSLDELERFLMEEGVVKRNKRITPAAEVAGPSTATDSNDVIDPNTVGKHIASDENTRFVHLKEIKKIIQENDSGGGGSGSGSGSGLVDDDENLPSPPKRAKITDELDEDMQLAIKLSLEQFNMENPSDLSNKSPEEMPENCNRVKLRPEQKKVLAKAAKSLAKAYMLEYGGMNSEDIDDLVHISDDEPCQSEFKYNNLSLIEEEKDDTTTEAEKPKEIATEAEKSSETSKKTRNTDVHEIHINDQDNDDVSSTADSDFIDVPEMTPELVEEFNVRAGFNEISCTPCDGDVSKDFVHSDLENIQLTNSEKKKILMEVIIKPEDTLQAKLEDDLFADVFNVVNKKLELPVENKIDEKNKSKEIENIVKLNPIQNKSSNLNDILNSLDKEMINLNEINLNIDLKKPIVIETNVSTIEISDTSDDDCDFNRLTQNQAPKTPTKTKQSSLSSFLNITPKKVVSTTPPPQEKYPHESPVTPKIKSPFFRKKTPTSSSRKKNQLNDEETNADHSKVSKSLFNDGDNNSTTAEPSSNTPINKTESYETAAAKILRDLKTNDELNEMIVDANQKSKELELERNKQNRLGKSITEQMSDDCKQLLRLFGIPFVVAPMEAEAQCAFFDSAKITDGTITDDSDIWLFGGQTVYKHFFDQQKNVLEFRSELIEKSFNIERSKLIQLAMLVGSDYTTGISGIGAVTALEILAAFPKTSILANETNNELMSLLSTLTKFKEWWINGKKTQTTRMPSENLSLRKKLKNIDIFNEFPNQNVAEAYLYPQINDNREPFTWGAPDPETLREFAKTTFGWTYSRTDELIQPVLKKFNDKNKQISIKNYFKTDSFIVQKDVTVSKRIRLAINKMSENNENGATKNNDDDVDDVIIVDDAVDKKATKNVPIKKNSKESSAKEDKKRRGQSKLTTKKSTASKSLLSPKPSTSTSTSSPTMSALSKQKKSKIPDFKPPIAQKEKQQKLEEENKQKAIKLFKQSKSKNSRK